MQTTEEGVKQIIKVIFRIPPLTSVPLPYLVGAFAYSSSNLCSYQHMYISSFKST